MAKFLKSGTISEQTIHKTIIEWVNLNVELRRFVIHIANERKCSSGYGKILKDMGVRKGVADLFIALPRKGFCGAWIEIKSEKGRVSEEQRQFLTDMSQQGYFTQIVYSIDEGIKAIKDYCES